jgi:hypothetical protein
MSSHLEWKSVIMALICNFFMSANIFYTVRHAHVQSMSGQDLNGLIFNIWIGYACLNMICFGAKWAAELISSKVPGLNKSAPTETPKQ